MYAAVDFVKLSTYDRNKLKVLKLGHCHYFVSPNNFYDLIVAA
jgi:hypothetical protein